MTVLFLWSVCISLSLLFVSFYLFLSGLSLSFYPCACVCISMCVYVYSFFLSATHSLTQTTTHPIMKKHATLISLQNLCKSCQTSRQPAVCFSLASSPFSHPFNLNNGSQPDWKPAIQSARY